MFKFSNHPTVCSFESALFFLFWQISNFILIRQLFIFLTNLSFSSHFHFPHLSLAREINRPAWCVLTVVNNETLAVSAIITYQFTAYLFYEPSSPATRWTDQREISEAKPVYSLLCVQRRIYFIHTLKFSFGKKSSLFQK
jgi:hypothetical protein